jgi:hypothetical protein
LVDVKMSLGDHSIFILPSHEIRPLPLNEIRTQNSILLTPRK